MAKYQLVYFNVKGRGESIRLLFAAAGQKYDDKRIEFAQWGGDEKKNAPQGTLPYLVINGKTKVGQSMAILRYLAKEFKLYGKSNMDALYIDQIIDTVVDLGSKGGEAMFEKDEAKKKTLMEKYTNETVPHYCDLLEKCVKQSGKDAFAVGNSLTVADIVIYGGLDNTACLGVIDKYPALKANRAKVDSDKNIAKYVKERPKTQF